MSSAPIRIHLHIGDYIRDTEDLSLLQHGVYLRLMMVYYSTGKPLPNDISRLCRRVHASSVEESSAVEYVLSEFFVLEGPVWMHKRIESELDEWRNKTESAQQSANARWEKSKENNKTKDANALRTQCDGNASLVPYPVSRIPVKSKALSGKPDDALEVLNFLNSKTGKAYRATRSNLDLILARLKDGASVQDCKQVIARKVMDWIHDDKMRSYLRPATLFNRTKFDQYTGELVI